MINNTDQLVQDFTCKRCLGELDLPLYCNECKAYYCSNCYQKHLWEALPIPNSKDHKTGLE